MRSDVILPMSGGELDFATAMLSPCLTCATSPCCTYLPLETFSVATLTELDHAAYLLNFEHIEVGLSSAGEWSAYYRYPCRFLDRADFSCRVHATAQQPNICVHYNPYTCWYRGAFGPDGMADFVRLDRRRLMRLADELTFDADRRLIGVPDWSALHAELEGVPLETGPTEFGGLAFQDDVASTWEDAIRQGQPLSSSELPMYGYADARLRSPCESCRAYCCTTLLFPQAWPANVSGLDFYRFCLGFPGVEVGIGDEEWWLVVRTRCRHLQHDRCSIFGQPERPLACRYYDEWTCAYRGRFGQPRPAGFMRIRLEQFDGLAECFGFDENGAVVERPSVEMIRDNVERHIRTAPSSRG